MIAEAKDYEPAPDQPAESESAKPETEKPDTPQEKTKPDGEKEVKGFRISLDELPFGDPMRALFERASAAEGQSVYQKGRADGFKEALKIVTYWDNVPDSTLCECDECKSKAEKENKDTL